MRPIHIIYLIGGIAILCLIIMQFGVLSPGIGSYPPDRCSFKDEKEEHGITCSTQNYILQGKEDSTAIMELKNDFGADIYVFSGKANIRGLEESSGSCELVFDANNNFIIDDDDNTILNEPIRWPKGEWRTLIVGCAMDENTKSEIADNRLFLNVSLMYYPNGSTVNSSGEIRGLIFSRVGGKVYSLGYSKNCEEQQIQFWHDICLLRLKDKTQNTCNAIVDEGFRSGCLEQIAQS
ncbi:hypothetical protein JXB28_01005 [Candidatus Woesearchaeota archaeon]|nr:hypothetical protein [Candidatus Woesearchaeota archaeon]